MEPLREMFRYHEWATRTLIEHCMTVPPERLSEPAAGTYGAILPTLVHLLAAEQRYLYGMTREEADPSLREGMEPPLADLLVCVERQARRWDALIDRAGELDVTLPGRGAEPDLPHATNLLFLQAIHHGNDHRTQVCSALTTLGLPSPDIDGWVYWDATHM
jgi:uncharacterized damage-inducible protein DinB